MKQSIANLARTVVLLLLLVPAPIAVVNTAPAMAAQPEVMAAAPAVELPAAEPAATEHPWTSRFLAPAAVVIAVVAVGASALYYVVRIRGRYRVGS